MFNVQTLLVFSDGLVPGRTRLGWLVLLATPPVFQPNQIAEGKSLPHPRDFDNIRKGKLAAETAKSS